METLSHESTPHLEHNPEVPDPKAELDADDFIEIAPNRRLSDLQTLSPAEQDQLTQYWGQKDLQLLDDSELSNLAEHAQSVLENKRSGYSPVAWLSKAVGGRPYLENIEKLHSAALGEIARRQEESVKPYRDLDSSLRALRESKNGQRESHLATAKDALKKIGPGPLPDFLKGGDTTLLHRAIQSGDPELAEAAVRALADKRIDGHEILYEPDANGKAPTTYLAQTHQFASTLLALQEMGFDPAKLGDRDLAQYQNTRDEIAKNIALNAFLKPGHYWLALGLANNAFKSADVSAGSSRQLVGRTNQYEKPLKELAGKGDPAFWPTNTGTTPLHILVRSGDTNAVRDLTLAFGNAWSSEKDSQGKLASDYANSAEMKAALKQLAMSQMRKK